MDDTRGNSRHVRTVRIILHFDGNSGISVKRVLIFIHLPAVEIVSTIDDSSRVVREDLKQSSIFRTGLFDGRDRFALCGGIDEPAVIVSPIDSQLRMKTVHFCTDGGEYSEIHRTVGN